MFRFIFESEIDRTGAERLSCLSSPQTAALLRSDAGSHSAEPALRLVIEGNQTSCFMLCPIKENAVRTLHEVYLVAPYSQFGDKWKRPIPFHK